MSAGLVAKVLREQPAATPSFPSPPPMTLVSQVDAAHLRAAEGLGSELKDSGPVQDFLAALAQLHRVEAEGRTHHSDQALQEQAQQSAVLARSAAKLLGEQAWQALAIWISSEAITSLERINDEALRAKKPWALYVSSLSPEAKRSMREGLGGFPEQVMLPTDLLPTSSQALAGWQATARCLFLLRILMMAKGELKRPSHLLLPRAEQRLYLRWKVERAHAARKGVRLEALHQLVALELSYPAADAEAWISGAQQK